MRPPQGPRTDTAPFRPAAAAETRLRRLVGQRHANAERLVDDQLLDKGGIRHQTADQLALEPNRKRTRQVPVWDEGRGRTVKQLGGPRAIAIAVHEHRGAHLTRFGRASIVKKRASCCEENSPISTMPRSHSGSPATVRNHSSRIAWIAILL